MAQPYLSQSMRFVLQNITAGRSPSHGLSGMGQMAQLQKTLQVLRLRGLVTESGHITDVGRAALGAIQEE